MSTTTKRSLTKDTKPLKADLERIVADGEGLLKSQVTWWDRLKYGIQLSGNLINLHSDYQELRDKINQDAAVSNKKAYAAEVILNSASYLAKQIIERYL